MQPKHTYTYSQVAHLPEFSNHIPSTVVASMAATAHSKIITSIVKCNNLLNEPLVAKYKQLTAVNTDMTQVNGYTVSPAVALLVATQYNNALRHKILEHLKSIDEDYYNSIIESTTYNPAKSIKHKAWNKRIIFAAPTELPTVEDFVRHAQLANVLQLTVNKLYMRLVEAGLLREAPKDKIFGHKITALGSDYIREYRSKDKNYFVFDKKPIIDILRTIAASKV